MKVGVFTLEGLLVVALIYLLKTNAQECSLGFNSDAMFNINETTPYGTVIYVVPTSPGNVICFEASTLASTKIGYTHNETNFLAFRMEQEIGDDLDNNKLQFLPGAGFFLSLVCQLTCSLQNRQIIDERLISFVVQPQNTKAPIFNFKSISLDLNEIVPVGYDFGDLLVGSNNGILIASDKDLPINPQANITFYLNNTTNFVTIPPRENVVQDENNVTRVNFQPRIAVKSALNAKDSPIVFDLIATDKGDPAKEDRCTITVNIIPYDLRDPAFTKNYYTSYILNFNYTGLLESDEVIQAFDGDTSINATLDYNILDKGLRLGGLNVELVQTSGGGVKLKLIEPVSALDQISYVVIEAVQRNNMDRKGKVVVAVQLPCGGNICQADCLPCYSTSISYTDCQTDSQTPSTISSTIITTTNFTSHSSLATTTVANNITTETDPSTPSTINPATVQFEKQLYWSEVIENTPQGTMVIQLMAISSSEEHPLYSLIDSPTAKLFSVDSKSGVVTTTEALPFGNYNFTAYARISSGHEDNTTLIVSAVKGTDCNGTQFSSALYDFPAIEQSTGIIGSVTLRSTDNATKYDLSISSCDPQLLKNNFKIESNGDVKVAMPFSRTVSGPKIILTISAMDSEGARIVPITTVVKVDVLDVNEKPQFGEYSLYGKSVTVGYPRRTYFDPAIFMPIFTPQVIDSDIAENASLIYYLTNGVDIFDIDSQTGSLFVKGTIASLDATDKYVQIIVKDGGGLQDHLNITVKSLEDDCITLLKANASITLTAEVISYDMSRILGYKVYVLRMENQESNRRGIIVSNHLRNVNFDYSITVYAVNQTEIVDRNSFATKIIENKAFFTELNWTLNVEDFSAPLEYEVQKTIESATKKAHSSTVIAAILATLLGLAFVLVIGGAVYVKRYGTQYPWSTTTPSSRTSSLQEDKKHWDERELSKPENGGKDQPTSPAKSYNSEVYEQHSEVKINSTYLDATDLIKNDEKWIQTPLGSENEVYCPPSPVPKKSILKDSGALAKKMDEKKLEDTIGVKFSSSPEVIQVAATALDPEENATDIQDSSDDESFLTEVL